ncbi:hypothetical protein [Streptomyces olivaceus]|uniref:hypothetical protein n=1 Tax=Streptomyces olivaceus TaxID=47716 RepID=UPI003723A88D
MNRDAVRAAVGPQLAALTLVRALMGGALERKGLEQTIDQARGGVDEGLRYMSTWARGADLRAELAPIVCALGRTAVAALAITQDGDPAAVSHWLDVQARTVREQGPNPAVEHPADSVTVGVAALFAEELHRTGEAGQEELAGREQKALDLVEDWVRPGAAGQDHPELLLSGGWFAAVMLAHAFAFDERRMQAYVDDHARALALAGR